MDNRFWNKKTREQTPYVPGEQTAGACIKLNTNENPYPPSPRVRELISQFDTETLRLYPDPTSSLLKETIAGYYGIDKSQIFLGNGSDEVLALAFQAFFDQTTPIAYPDVTYSFYPVYSSNYSVPSTLILLSEDFTIPIEDFKAFPGSIVIANPNAPTGVFIELSAIKELLLSNRERLVIVDEAYIDFGGESAVGLINEFDNILVVQTVSKSRSLAGLRVGYAMGDLSLVKALECARDSFNSYTIDTLAQKIAVVAFEDGAWFENTRAAIMETRKWTADELAKIGFVTLPSKANFIFTTHPDFCASELYELLREKGILIRYFNKPRIDNFLRISIGTNEQMIQLISTLEKIVKGEQL